MKIGYKTFCPTASDLILSVALIKTTKRITFQIDFQAWKITNKDPDTRQRFVASNGYDIISEHRMDVDAYRLWLWGAADDQSAVRSGSRHTPTQALCDADFAGYLVALEEFANHHNGRVFVQIVDFLDDSDIPF